MTWKYQVIAILILVFFYTVYLGKMAIQRKQGIVTNQIGKDKTNQKRFRVERMMKFATYGIVVVELVSIFWGQSLLHDSGKTVGMIFGIVGDLIFLMAVYTMGVSWRAGVAADDHRKLVCNGIFRISRNPAFLGFDLVYLSILLLFFNWVLLVFTVFAIVMLHLQMLQEEQYLAQEFGQEYLDYKKKVCRYFGRRNWQFAVAVILVIVIVGIFIVNNYPVF